MRLPYWLTGPWLWWYVNNRWAALMAWLVMLDTEPLDREELAWAYIYARKTVKNFDRGMIHEHEFCNIIRDKMFRAGVLDGHCQTPACKV